ncbi:MAG: hypothetical protein WAR83_04945 [Flavobacteriales bacterium]
MRHTSSLAGFSLLSLTGGTGVGSERRTAPTGFSFAHYLAIIIEFPDLVATHPPTSNAHIVFVFTFFEFFFTSLTSITMSLSEFIAIAKTIVMPGCVQKTFVEMMTESGRVTSDLCSLSLAYRN